jgi:hypothetical protein
VLPVPTVAVPQLVKNRRLRFAASAHVAVYGRASVSKISTC